MKYTLNIVKTGKNTFMLKSKKDIELLEKVLVSAWGKEKFKKVCEFYKSLDENNKSVNDALDKHFNFK